MTAPEVITAWTEQTGQSWQLIPCIVRDQACEFATAGFTREDMALVVQWTRAQIAKGNHGMNKLSLTWRVMADDQWAKFQERLEIARAWKRPAPSAPLRVVPDPQPAPDQLWSAGSAAMAAWKAGRSA